MRIAVVSDTRLPTRADGGHGLGMSAHSIATGLAKREHRVTLFAGPGSDYPRLVVAGDEPSLSRLALDAGFDAILDTSHTHPTSRMEPEAPVLNRICDLECEWRPPNAVVNSPFMQGLYGGRLVNTGVDVEAIPFYPQAQGYVAFMASKHPGKGWPRVREIAAAAGYELHVIAGLSGAKKWRALGGAYALLHPTENYAADRAPLEAAAAGVPVLCLSGDGSEYHVADGVSGFVCGCVDDMIDALLSCRVSALRRRACRGWVAEAHGLEQMIDGYEALLEAVADGERW